jgi:hypothetical protein
MAYPDTVDELTDGVPADGIAAATPLGSGTYPHDDHHRALGVAVEAIETQLVGAYTTYTPTLTATTTSPTLGSGSTAAGYYKRVGRMVFGYCQIVFGTSGTNAGSGYYGLLLPVVPANRDQPIGIGYCFDNNDNNRFVVASAAVSTYFWSAATAKAIIVVTNIATEGIGSGDNPVGAAVPWAWEASDQILIQFSYEAAAAS